MPRLPSTGSFWEGPQHSRTQPTTPNSRERRGREREGKRKRKRGRNGGGERERESGRERARASTRRMRSGYTFCQAEGMAGTSYWEARSISIDFSRFLHLSLVCRGPWRRKASGAHFKGIEKNLFPDLQRTCSMYTRSSTSASSNPSTIACSSCRHCPSSWRRASPTHQARLRWKEGSW